jgi:hypothetical protein
MRRVRPGVRDERVEGAGSRATLVFRVQTDVFDGEERPMTLRYFMDTEFYEDGRTIDLISIGVVCSNGTRYYAESSEARHDLVSPWVRDNVLPHLKGPGTVHWLDRARIAEDLADYIRPEHGKKHAEVWGYYADYDWVVLCQLFGAMMSLPRHFPMFCLDPKQLSMSKGDPKHPEQKSAEHNALNDAEWNRDLYDFLMTQPVKP